MLRQLDLFSGIGGFSLGMEATGGFETVAFCEIEEFPRKVLQKHWPHVKQYKDIKELTYDTIKEDGIGPIDIITGGYPCQPFSNAGRKKGEKDPRHLWPEMFRLIKECRPSWVCAENVSGHIKLGLDSVLSDMENEGFQTRTLSISASSVGANHKRERVWILAYSERNNDKQEIKGVNGEKKKISRKHRKEDSDARKPGGTSAVRKASNEHVEDTRRSLRQGSEFQGKNENEIEKENANLTKRSGEASHPNVADTQGVHAQGQHDGQGERQSWGEGWWAIEPKLGRVGHGIPDRVHRLKALGNSLVPAIPYYLGIAILESMKDA
jgi:DNA (cytosine-5)-methyltransferase 1